MSDHHDSRSRRLGHWIADRSVVPLARRSERLRGLLRYVARRVPGVVVPHADAVYAHLRECFIRNGERSRYGVAVRRGIVERFEAIDRGVTIASSPTDGLFLAEATLSTEASGDIVECGCYQGGSSAKLSVLARVTGRRLVVFDSFQGLPDSDEYNKHDLHVRLPSDFMTPWKEGEWAGSLEIVAGNVQRFGERDVCTFVKGWFADTLTDANLPQSIALAFTDVDIPSSARECLMAIWPRLMERGVYFSHDVGFIKVLKELTDDRLWRDVLREPVPMVLGAGYGLGDTSRMLGFMVKGADLPAEYLHNLTLDK